MELLDQGHEVDIYESRPWIGGKVASFTDKDGNHIEMGLHVFFGCYFNLFRLMAKCGVLENLLLKDHTHTFVNTGGDVRELDFRFFVGDTKIGAPFHGAGGGCSGGALGMMAEGLVGAPGAGRAALWG